MKLSKKLSTNPIFLSKVKEHYEELKRKCEIQFNFKPVKTLKHEDGSILGANSTELKAGTIIYVQTDSKEWKVIPDGEHNVVTDKGQRAKIKVEAGVVTEVKGLPDENKAPVTNPTEKQGETMPTEKMSRVNQKEAVEIVNKHANKEKRVKVFTDPKELQRSVWPDLFPSKKEEELEVVGTSVKDVKKDEKPLMYNKTETFDEVVKRIREGAFKR